MRAAHIILLKLPAVNLQTRIAAEFAQTGIGIVSG